MWRKPPHGLSITYVKNRMLRDTFEFMRHNIHFSKNSKTNQKGVLGYDNLFKVSYSLQIIMNGVRGVWTSRNNGTSTSQLIIIHVLIMIFLSSGCQMDQGMGCNKDSNLMQKSRSRLRMLRCTIFSAQIDATRSRFDF